MSSTVAGAKLLSELNSSTNSPRSLMDSSSEISFNQSDTSQVSGIRLHYYTESAIGEEEFDAQATVTVQRHWQMFEDALYQDGVRGAPPANAVVAAESQEWKQHFPHFRIRGQSIEPPDPSARRSVGGSPAQSHRAIPHATETPRTRARGTTTASDPQPVDPINPNLTIEGTSARLSSPQGIANVAASLEGEVLASHGDVHEFDALDSSMLGGAALRRRRMPSDPLLGGHAGAGAGREGADNRPWWCAAHRRAPLPLLPATTVTASTSTSGVTGKRRAAEAEGDDGVVAEHSEHGRGSQRDSKGGRVESAPPSPREAIREAVLAHLLDAVWQQLVPTLQPLIVAVTAGPDDSSASSERSSQSPMPTSTTPTRDELPIDALVRSRPGTRSASRPGSALHQRVSTPDYRRLPPKSLNPHELPAAEPPFIRPPSSSQYSLGSAITIRPYTMTSKRPKQQLPLPSGPVHTNQQFQVRSVVSPTPSQLSSDMNLKRPPPVRGVVPPQPRLIKGLARKPVPPPAPRPAKTPTSGFVIKSVEFAGSRATRGAEDDDVAATPSLLPPIQPPATAPPGPRPVTGGYRAAAEPEPISIMATRITTPDLGRGFPPPANARRPIKSPRGPRKPPVRAPADLSPRAPSPPVRSKSRGRPARSPSPPPTVLSATPPLTRAAFTSNTKVLPALAKGARRKGP